jgi:integrase
MYQNSASNLRTLPTHRPLLSALNTALVYYVPNVTREVRASTIGAPADVLERLHPVAVAALYVIFAWNMRSAEYLRSRASDILSHDRLLIHGAKGSRSYIISLPGIEQQLGSFRISCPGMAVAGISYHKLWTQCVKAGIGALLPNHVNASRLHLSRYSLAAELAANGEQLVSDCLRHRSLTSAKNYMPQEG